MQNIADRIRSGMDARGFSVQSLAEQTGIPRMTLTRRLADPGSLTLDEIDKLETALQADLLGPAANSAGSAA